jgi:hypothetical protein
MYMDCDYPIWVGGRYMGKTVERQSCGATDLATAKKIIAGLPGLPVVDQNGRGLTVADCITKYLKRRENELKDATRYSYKKMLSMLQEFASKNGITHVRQFTVEFLESFKHEGIHGTRLKKLRDSSRATYVTELRSFLRECECIGWIEARLADRVRPLPFAYEERPKACCVWVTVFA